MTNAEMAENVGIIAMEIYFPKNFVSQEKLEEYDGVSAGKYTVGLGQIKMAFCNDNEDIYSMALTVVLGLMEKYKISPNAIGRLEVGTETILDKSKSVKSVLMQIFQQSGNTDVVGVDNINACYGGTAALMNSLAWMESKEWDGRYALVVAGDIAVYSSGPARPTGGAGIVAMLLGPNASLVFERGLSASHMEHAYDFYKPVLNSEYPEVDGKLSVSCYLRSVDVCYNRFMHKLAIKDNIENPNLNNIDYFVFHCPYSKLVQKSFARLEYNDFLRNPINPKYSNCQDLLKISIEDSYFNREIEKAFLLLSQESFDKKASKSLVAAKNLGNIYCGSLYAGLISLISCEEDLVGKRIAMFSYGSGLAATLFSIRVASCPKYMASSINLFSRLKLREESDPANYVTAMEIRENCNVNNYTPSSSPLSIEAGAFYLTNIDEKYRRNYERKQ